ncbi:hypothetical protein KM043_011946 [Ampulex compressa]|nr:hypothetical protein KM043_011946 [Ampulex compressa]
MTVDDCFGGSSTTCSVTENLHCLEEKRTEFIHRDDGLREKTIFIGAEEDLYHINVTHTCPCNKHMEKKDIPFCRNNKILSEGGNILLMRYLAIVNYKGTFSLECLTINGDVAISDYTCTTAEDMNLTDQDLAMYTIDRKIYTEDGLAQNIKTHLTSDGRILRHDWIDAPYFLKINPLIDLSVPIKSAQIETPLKDRWTEDIEMFSKYLDMKVIFSLTVVDVDGNWEYHCFYLQTRNMSECIEYLDDHPEIKQLIADYTQTLLIVKPVNVLEFTVQHFKAFATDPKVWEDDFLTEQFDTDVIAQLQKNELNGVITIK